ncbi:metal-dependent hydrolase [Halorubrum halodurans]|uniref:Metal-dependent hydrolase n=1 Tax=Halorubrum halodurans TaxID=1383851 RepID=A0A256IKX5_9EURY|nr:metal-dependent hydrolase [Halorubrum halodurans]OYR57093.1 metal-dependent hydrolase [Halorubrum halodurans]
MYRKGHVGAALAAYAPVGFGLAAVAGLELAAGAGVVAAWTAMLPDLDTRIPFVKHRGITHTVWFALAVGVAFGLVGGAVGLEGGSAAALGFAALGFALGAGTVVSHLLADAITPMGIRPYAPVRGDHYTLDLVAAANPVANYVLLVLGGAAAGVAVLAGAAVGG